MKKKNKFERNKAKITFISLISIGSVLFIQQGYSLHYTIKKSQLLSKDSAIYRACYTIVKFSFCTNSHARDFLGVHAGNDQNKRKSSLDRRDAKDYFTRLIQYRLTTQSITSTDFKTSSKQTSYFKSMRRHKVLFHHFAFQLLNEPIQYSKYYKGFNIRFLYSSVIKDQNLKGFNQVENMTAIDLIRLATMGHVRYTLLESHLNNQMYVMAYATGRKFGPDIDFGRNQFGGVFRIAVHPVANTDYDLHVGFSGIMFLDGINRRYGQVLQRQLMLSSTNYMIRNIQNVNNIWSTGPEISLRWKRLFLNAEYHTIYLGRIAGSQTNRPSLRFPAWYLETSYTILGPPRIYNQERADFVSLAKPSFNPRQGEWGTVEGFFRYSVMNLKSQPSPFNLDDRRMAINGGRQTVIAAGIKWYVSSNAKLMIQYNYVTSASSKSNYYNLLGYDSRSLVARLQMTF